MPEAANEAICACPHGLVSGGQVACRVKEEARRKFLRVVSLGKTLRRAEIESMSTALRHRELQRGPASDPPVTCPETQSLSAMCRTDGVGRLEDRASRPSRQEMVRNSMKEGRSALMGPCGGEPVGIRRLHVVFEDKSSCPCRASASDTKRGFLAGDLEPERTLYKEWLGVGMHCHRFALGLDIVWCGRRQVERSGHAAH